MTTFADRMNEAMGLIPNKVLERKTGIGESTIRSYRKGITLNPSSQNLAKIADALGISIHWLATGEGPMRPTDPPTVQAPIQIRDVDATPNHVRILHPDPQHLSMESDSEVHLVGIQAVAIHLGDLPESEVWQAVASILLVFEKNKSGGGGGESMTRRLNLLRGRLARNPAVTP